MGWIRAEGVAYWSLFCAVFLAVAIWETAHPRRKLSRPAEQRWVSHAILFSIGIAAMLLVLRIGAVAVAAAAQGNPYGLLNREWIPVPARWVAAILLLDFVRYWEHRLFHGVGWLWRIHEVHHSDPDYDVSTAVRFHPIESIAMQAGYYSAIVLLAPPPAAVLTAELLGSTVNLYAHANASLPDWLDVIVRAVFVTPNLHRIHHSEEISEQGRNLGQALSLWDRMFGTFLDAPAAGADGLVTGLKGATEGDALNVKGLLAKPFRTRPASLPRASRSLAASAENQ